MRDDTDSLNLPPSAKRYLRLRGAAGVGPAKPKLWKQSIADIVNGGDLRLTNKDVAGKVPRTFEARLADRLVAQLLD